MVVKQWLEQYLSVKTRDRKESLAIRQLRYIGLTKSKVSFIIQMLPVLLQAALLSFFAGLLILLWGLDDIVAGLVTSIVAVWLLLWGQSIALSVLFVDCPYKSLEALILGRIGSYLIWHLRWMLNWTMHVYRLSIRTDNRSGSDVESSSKSDTKLSLQLKPFDWHTWLARERKSLEEDSKVDILCWKAVDFAGKNVLDDMIILTAIQAMYEGDQEGKDVLKTANSVWEQIAVRVQDDKLEDWIPDSSRATCTLMDMAAGLLTKYPFRWSCNVPELNLKETLTHALVRYAICRFDDTPDRGVIAKILSLPVKVYFEYNFPLDVLKSFISGVLSARNSVDVDVVTQSQC